MEEDTVVALPRPGSGVTADLELDPPLLDPGRGDDAAQGPDGALEALAEASPEPCSEVAEISTTWATAMALLP
jgi:hypothetical protein